MARLTLSRSAAYELMRRLPHIRVGRQAHAIRITRLALERYLERGGDAWARDSTDAVASGTVGATTRTVADGAPRRSSTTARPPRSSQEKSLGAALLKAPL